MPEIPVLPPYRVYGLEYPRLKFFENVFLDFLNFVFEICFWKNVLKIVFEKAFWKFFNLFFKNVFWIFLNFVFEICFWKNVLKLFFKLIFFIDLFFEFFFEICFWKSFQKKVFENFVWKFCLKLFLFYENLLCLIEKHASCFTMTLPRK